MKSPLLLLSSTCGIALLLGTAPSLEAMKPEVQELEKSALQQPGGTVPAPLKQEDLGCESQPDDQIPAPLTPTEVESAAQEPSQKENEPSTDDVTSSTISNSTTPGNITPHPPQTPPPSEEQQSSSSASSSSISMLSTESPITDEMIAKASQDIQSGLSKKAQEHADQRALQRNTAIERLKTEFKSIYKAESISHRLMNYLQGKLFSKEDEALLDRLMCPQTLNFLKKNAVLTNCHYIKDDETLFLAMSVADLLYPNFLNCCSDTYPSRSDRENNVGILNRLSTEHLRAFIRLVDTPSYQRKWAAYKNHQRSILWLYGLLEPKDLSFLLDNDIPWKDVETYQSEIGVPFTRDQWRQLLTAPGLWFLNIKKVDYDSRGVLNARFKLVQKLTPEQMKDFTRSFAENQQNLLKPKMDSNRQNDVLLRELRRYEIQINQKEKGDTSSSSTTAATPEKVAAVSSSHTTTANALESALQSDSHSLGHRLAQFIKGSDFSERDEAVLPLLMQEENLAFLRSAPLLWSTNAVAYQLDGIWGGERLFLIASMAKDLFENRGIQERRDLIDLLKKTEGTDHLYSLALSLRQNSSQWPQDNDLRRLMLVVYFQMNPEDLPTLLEHCDQLKGLTFLNVKKSQEATQNGTRDLWVKTLPFGDVLFSGFNDESRYYDVKNRLDSFRDLSPDFIQRVGTHLRANKKLLFKNGISRDVVIRHVISRLSQPSDVSTPSSPEPAVASTSLPSSTSSVSTTTGSPHETMAQQIESNLDSPTNILAYRLATFVRSPEFPARFEPHLTSLMRPKNIEILTRTPHILDPYRVRKTASHLHFYSSAVHVFLIASAASELFGDMLWDGEDKNVIEAMKPMPLDHLETLIVFLKSEEYKRHWPTSQKRREEIKTVCNLFSLVSPTSLPLILQHKDSLPIFKEIFHADEDSWDFKLRDHWKKLRERGPKWWEQLIPLSPYFFNGRTSSEIKERFYGLQTLGRPNLTGFKTYLDTLNGNHLGEEGVRPSNTEKQIAFMAALTTFRERTNTQE